jgi:tetratricopeptide (TPR) repeat protein
MPGVGEDTAVRQAASLLRQRRADDAERLLRDQVEARPDDPIAQSNLGVAFSAQGRHEDAALCFRRAAELKPDYAEAHYNLGTALAALGKTDEAARCYHQATALGGGRSELAIRVGQAFLAARRPEAAIAAYRGALRGQPDSTVLLVALGRALRVAGRDDAAIACFRQVLDRTPGNIAASLEAGEACMWKGRTDEAWTYLSGALRTLADAEWRPRASASPRERRFDSGAAGRALFALQDALAAAGVRCFLNGGTALGCVRESDFIAFDHDIDVGVLPGTEPAQVIDALETAKDLRFDYYDTWLDRVLRVRFVSSARIGGDIFFYHEDEDGFWCGVQRGPLAIRWRDSRFDLAPMQFRGRTVLVPDPVERYLTENYGNWRTPDPYHIPAFSAPNVIGGYGIMARCVAYSYLGKAIALGDMACVKRYSADILARDPDDALIAKIYDRTR